MNTNVKILLSAFCVFALCVCLSLYLSTSAHAEEYIAPEPVLDEGGDIIVPDPGDITTPDDGSGDLASDNRVTIGGLDFGGFVLNVGDIGNGSSIVEVVSSIAAPAADGLKASVEDILGTYTPRMESVTYYGADGTSYIVTRQVEGLAGLDFEWIATVNLYSLCLYCFFRMLGMVIQRC